MTNARLVGLDLVRGLCALAVMVYHYAHFAGWGSFDALGTYGVYIFFVLSGFALHYVYSSREISEKFLRDFFISRCLRIFPLFAVVALLRSMSGPLDDFSLLRLIVNATPLIGFADAAVFSGLVVGGWSIMIEWSFYLLFPLLLLFRPTMAVIAVFCFSLLLSNLYIQGAYYPPDYVNPSRVPWYTHTFTFLAYFVGGMLGAHFFSRYRERLLLVRWPLAMSLLIMAAIFALPHVVEFGGRKSFLSGASSTALICASSILVLLAAIREPSRILRRAGTFLGDISFGLYLLHPYIWQWTSTFNLSPPLRFAAAAGASICIAALVFRFFESPMRDIRKWRMWAKPKADTA